MIVTLTTDWGTRDYFGAMMKGRLCSLVPGLSIIDLSHEQTQGEWGRLRDLIRHGCMSFPEGTVHLIDVGSELVTTTANDPEEKSYRPMPVAISYRGQYLICSEQRPLRWSIDREPEQAVLLSVPANAVSYGFLSLDVFCDVVHGLAEGRSLDDYGEPMEQFMPIILSTVDFDGKSFDAKIMYTDRYGNAHLDVMYNDFERMRSGRRFDFDICARPGIGTHADSLHRVRRHYNDVQMGTLLLMVSRSGHLMLAVNGGSASQLLGLKVGQVCHVRFS